MKTDMFSSLKVIHGAARSTALSVAASMVIAAAFATPVSAFAAAPAAPAKTSKHAKAAKKPAAAPATKVSSKASKATKGAAAKTVAADDDAPRAGVKRKRVTYTSNGRHRSVVRRIAYEPRQPSVGQAFGLHETPDALMLRSSVAYVIDQNSGESLFDKNSRAVVPIASITKLMTAMVVLDSKEPMTDQIEVTDRSEEVV